MPAWTEYSFSAAQIQQGSNSFGLTPRIQLVTSRALSRIQRGAAPPSAEEKIRVTGCVASVQ